jgi:hypothetical protein
MLFSKKPEKGLRSSNKRKRGESSENRINALLEWRARRELNPRPTDFFAVSGLRVRRSSLAELRAHMASFEEVFTEQYRAYGRR